MPTFKSPWEFIKWFFGEMIKTFSSEPSFFSSKRIEKMLVFLNANIMLDVCVQELITQGKIDAIGSCAIYAAQMTYAGYTTKQIFNEKPKIAIKTESGIEDVSVIAEKTENVNN